MFIPPVQTALFACLEACTAQPSKEGRRRPCHAESLYFGLFSRVLVDDVPDHSVLPRFSFGLQTGSSVGLTDIDPTCLRMNDMFSFLLHQCSLLFYGILSEFPGFSVLYGARILAKPSSSVAGAFSLLTCFEVLIFCAAPTTCGTNDAFSATT